MSGHHPPPASWATAHGVDHGWNSGYERPDDGRPNLPCLRTLPQQHPKPPLYATTCREEQGEDGDDHDNHDNGDNWNGKASGVHRDDTNERESKGSVNDCPLLES